MRNPPPDWQPAGWTATASARTADRADYTLAGALGTAQWWILWTLLFLNTSAGISVISQEAPMFQELAHVNALGAATMVGIVSIGNAAGRVFWAWLSDIIGRKSTFLAMFLLQVILFFVLASTHSVAATTFVAFVILMCYGGGFGTMPAFAADYFGVRNVGMIYGLMLTAWGFASAFGPLLIAYLREVDRNYGHSLHVIAALMLVSASIPLLLRPPRPEAAAA